MLLFEIQSYYNKNERNQPYIKPDYRKYFPDAVVQKLDVLRNSAHLGEKLYVKPDCRKYYPDAVIQKLNIIRNSSKKARNVQKQDYRTYFPDAAIQSIVIIRNSVILQYEWENQPYIKPDYRKYFPDAGVQKLDILRNLTHEEEKLCIKPDC